jgi:ribonuclease HII
VILPRDRPIGGLDDSKKLRPAVREELFAALEADADVHVGVGVCSVEEIEALNILGATRRAMQAAVEALAVRPDFVLVDGMFIRGMTIPHRKVVRGDCLSASVAAASIVAKVTRDRSMDRYHRRFPGYGFDRHRGYGTAEHLAALDRLGPSPIHRLSFKGVGPEGTDESEGVG